MQGRRSVGLLLLLLGTHLYFANEFRAFANPNVRSRIYLTLAVSEFGQLSIDECIARFGTVQDIARHDGRIYSDKPPAYSILLIPFAKMLRWTILSPDNLHLFSILLRVLGTTLPCVAFWYFTRGIWFGLAGDEQRGTAVIMAAALGTNFLIYATQLFSHAIAGILLYLAYRLILVSRTPNRVAWVGFALGIAFASDYVIAPAAGALSVWTLWRFRDRAAAAATWLAVGAVPVALLWMAYNYACFGSAIKFSYLTHADPVYRPLIENRWLGLRPPDPAALLAMTLLPPHGIVLMSPFLLLAPLGWYRMWNERSMRDRAVVGAAIALTTGLFVTTLVDWRGGWSVSVRYLVPIIPFAIEAVAVSIARREARAARFVFVTGAILGIVQTALAAATFPDFPGTFRDPFYDLSVPLLLKGCVNGVIWNSGSSVLELAPFGVLVLIAIGRVSMVRPDLASARRDWRPVVIAILLIVAQLPVLLRPGYERRLMLADVMSKMGYTCKSDVERAKLHSETLATDPNNLFELMQLAWIRAASACEELRDGREAVRLAERAESAAPADNLDTLEVLAAAYAEAGRFEDARHAIRSALRLVDKGADSARAARLGERSREYDADRPIRLPKSGR